MRIECTLIDDSAALARLTPEWAELLARSGEDEVGRSPLWLSSWWRLFGGESGRALHVLALRASGRLIGVAPLLSRPHRYRRVIPFRRLELVGSGEDEADEICCEYIGVVADVEHRREVARAVVETLTSDTQWDEVMLTPMNGESEMPKLLVDEFARRGLHAEQRPLGVFSYIPLPKSWDAYLMALPARRRQNVKRAIRKLTDWADGDLKLHRVETVEQIAEARRALETLHAARWNMNGKLGAFASRRFRAFHDDVMPKLLEQGALDLFWLSARGEPVAARYNIIWKDRALAYLSGRRPKLPPGVSPGIVTHAYGIQNAIARGCREYDFLVGSRGPKRELALATRERIELRVVRDAPVEWARQLTELALQRAREIRDRLRERRSGPRPVEQERRTVTETEDD